MGKWEDDLVFVELDLNEQSDQRALHCICKSDFDFHIYDQKYLDDFLSCLNRIKSTSKQKLYSFDFNCNQFRASYTSSSIFLFDFVQCSLAIKINYKMIQSLLEGINSVMENRKLDS